MATRPAHLIAVLACVAMSPPVRAAELRALVVDDAGKPLPDAVVVAYPAGVRVEHARPGTAIEDQVDKEFAPYVQAIRVGTYVKFPNNDDICHHVYSFSAAKKFELPLYSGTPASAVLFDKVGVVRLGCNIHDWMIAYLYVTDAPYFGKTTAQGSVELKGLPGGTYRLRAWHPRLDAAEESTARQGELQDDTPAEVRWMFKLKREFRQRRTPLPGDAGYR